MKFVSWNVNGLRACMTKGFMDFFNEVDADFFCLQETKMQREQAEIITDGYFQFWNSASVKKGYSGTLIFAKKEPLTASYGFGTEKHNDEGRAITLEYDNFYLVNVYVPNAQPELARLPYRMEWEDDFRNYVCGLKEKKSVIICGDMNVAHNEIDLKNPSSNKQHPGFSLEERGKMTELLNSGFTDTYRSLNPDKTDAYTWWSYRFNARKNNAGWRIDYFIVSDDLRFKNAQIYSDIYGSDHCPVSLEI